LVKNKKYFEDKTNKQQQQQNTEKERKNLKEPTFLALTL